MTTLKRLTLGRYGRLLVLVAVVVVVSLADRASATTPGRALGQGIDPVQLHQALLRHPIEEWQLPPGFAGVQLVDVAVTPENAAMGELGNIDVTITTGPDQLNGGAYSIYATAEQAEAAIAQLIQRLGGDRQSARVEPVIAEWPTFVVSAAMPDPPLGVTAYLIQMESVVVAAFSGVLNQPVGDAEHARALAVLMAEQVVRLCTESPS
jgi:hypothetical protein